MVATKSKASLPKDVAKDKKFAIVVSRYHEAMTQRLLDGANEVLIAHGAVKQNIHAVWVPGSFEIPLAARALVHHNFDAVLCLGIIIKGETRHDRYIAREVARGIAQLNQVTGIPVIFGVLTTETVAQAEARCGGDKGNKGIESAEAALHMVHLLEEIKMLPGKQSKGVGF